MLLRRRGTQSPARTGVVITTTGSTFAPKVELKSGSTATVTWTVQESGATTTGLTPTLNFGSPGTRHVRMTVDDGTPAFDDVLTLNLGFNHDQDSGRYNIGGTYDWPSTPVSDVTNIPLMTDLKRFLAANSTGDNNPPVNSVISTVLDFSGMASLEFIECYMARVRGVNVSGCSSLIRLCLEQCDLRQPLDLNPVANTLRDLRAAAQQTGSMSFVTQTVPMAVQYHQCIRDQVVTNRPFGAMIPVVEEEWIWNTNQSGAYTTASTMGGSLPSNDNHYTSADLTGRFPSNHGGGADFRGNNLQSIVLTGCPGLVSLDLNTNALNQAAVDYVLATMDSFNTGAPASGFFLDLRNNTVPSATGLTHVTALQGRGWTVQVDSVAASPPTNTGVPTISGLAQNGQLLTASNGTWTNIPTGYTYQWQTSTDGGTVWTDLPGVTGNTKSVGSGDVGKKLRIGVTASNSGGSGGPVYSVGTSTVTEPGGPWTWTDDFNRANATGLGAVGNGWHTTSGGLGDGDIVSNNFVRTDNAAYQRVVTTGDGQAPADYSVETTMPQWGTNGWSPTPAYFGLTLRFNEITGNGIRVFFSGGGLTNLVVGNTASYNEDDHVISSPNFPASWTNLSATSHTLKATVVGDLVTIFCDGQNVGSITYVMNSGLTNSSFGFVGEGGGKTFTTFSAYS